MDRWLFVNMPLCLLFCWILLIASCRSFASCYLIFSCIALLRNDLAVRLRPASSFPDISLGVCPPRRLRWQTTQKLARPTARLLARPPRRLSGAPASEEGCGGERVGAYATPPGSWWPAAGRTLAAAAAASCRQLLHYNAWLVSMAWPAVAWPHILLHTQELQ